MSLFGGFLDKRKQSKDYQLTNWLDKIMEQELPKGIIAYNCNLYEGSNGTYDIQIVGADEYNRVFNERRFKRISARLQWN